MEIGYKWIKDDMKSANGDELPWEIGVWKEWKGELELCKTGFHASQKPLDSLNYVYGNRWFLVEAEGTIIHGTDKFVSSRMRLTKELPAKEIMISFANCLFRFDSFASIAFRGLPLYREADAVAWATETAAWAAWAAAKAAAKAAWAAAKAAEIKWQGKKLEQIIQRSIGYL